MDLKRGQQMCPGLGLAVPLTASHTWEHLLHAGLPELACPGPSQHTDCGPCCGTELNKDTFLPTISSQFVLFCLPITMATNFFLGAGSGPFSPLIY